MRAPERYQYFYLYYYKGNKRVSMVRQIETESMGRPIEVLLVEDNPADARLLREAVEDVAPARIQLTHTTSLRSALQRVDSSNPRGPSFDIVLLDLSLPDVQGLETIARFHRAAPTIPIVVLTGIDNEETALNAIHHGAQDYLVKGKVDGALLLRVMHYATERKRSTDALRRSEEYYRSLIENAQEVILVLNEDGAIRYASPAIDRVLGYSASESVGKLIFNVMHPDDRTRMQRELSILWSDPGSARACECRFQHSDGSWRVLEAVGKNLSKDAGVRGVVINGRDVTERKRADEQLRSLNDQLDAVIQTSPLAIFCIDLEGCVCTWNRASEAIFGWSAAKVLYHRLPIILPGDEVQFQTLLRRARSGETVTRAGGKMVREDGAEISVDLWTSGLRDSSGTVHGIVNVVADTTESKLLEEQLLQAQKMEAVGRLAGGVAHDFNNLLTVINGYCQLIFDRLPTGDENREDLATALQATDRATDLTKQLLMFSRRTVVVSKIVDLNAIVLDMHRMLRRVISEQVELILTVSPIRGWMLADASQIELVILNLAMNARDAMPNGGTLTIETGERYLDSAFLPKAPDQGGKRYLMLAVSDVGTGIDPKLRPRLFEPFFTTKPKGEGTGLGLPTSYGIVKQHGGNIFVQSTVGLGTTFRIYLPAVETGPAEISKAEEVARLRGTETILLVEDEDGVRRVVQDMLRSNGYTVLSTADPEEGLALAAAHPEAIQLLVSDLIMPRLTGVDLAEMIHQVRPQLKVLFMSGYSESQVADRVKASGAAFLQKPFTLEVLGAKIRAVLDDGTRNENQRKASLL